jgi:HAMP domain-containing protein
LLLGLVIAFFIARGIIGPLSGLTAGMKGLAGGNFSVVLPRLDRKDEVGDMAQAVETFKVKAEEKARDEAEAQIKHDQVVARQRKADMIKLADAFEGAVGEIIKAVSSASTELEASAGYAHGDCDSFTGTDHYGRGRFRRGVYQRAIGSLGDRRTHFVGQRDQPPSAGICTDGQ